MAHLFLFPTTACSPSNPLHTHPISCVDSLYPPGLCHVCISNCYLSCLSHYQAAAPHLREEEQGGGWTGTGRDGEKTGCGGLEEAFLLFHYYSPNTFSCLALVCFCPCIFACLSLSLLSPSRVASHLPPFLMCVSAYPPPPVSLFLPVCLPCHYTRDRHCLLTPTMPATLLPTYVNSSLPVSLSLDLFSLS